jgi:hypothetical protein
VALVETVRLASVSDAVRELYLRRVGVNPKLLVTRPEGGVECVWKYME